MILNVKKTGALLLSICLASTLLASCGDSGKTEPPKENGNENTQSAATEKAEGQGEKVVVKYPTYQVGTHVGAKFEKQMLERFNEEYGDRITLEVEELPSDDAYTNKMKILAASNELPNIVDAKNGVRDLAVKNGQALDLTPILDADPEYRKEIGEGAIEAMTIDGKVYSISNANVTVGYFYNKTMFEDAGIEPAKTWEEYMTNCDKLLEKGHTPLALMTGENSWTTNLILASMVGTNGESGNKFMNTMYPETYQVPEMVEALTTMQTMLQKYTTEDAVGAIYANAANNFEQEQCAMIANGLWMTEDFSNPEKSVEGFEERVGFAVYPGTGLVSNYDIGFIMCAEDEATKEASTELLKFLTNGEAQKLRMEMRNVVPLTDNIEMSDEFLAANPFFGQLMKARETVDYEYMNFDLSAHASVVDAFGKYYPDLAYGTITPEEMTVKLDEAAAASK